MKTGQIVKEELKKEFPEMAETVLERAVSVVCEKIAPRLMTEAEEPIFKMIGTGLATAYPLLKSTIEKVTDLNKDGI